MWQKYAERLRGQFSGERAFWQACEIYRLERWFTFPNFERSAAHCAEQLAAAGLADVAVEEFPADGHTSWSGWRSMKAWDVTSARLWVTSPQQELLSDWTVNPHSLVMYSGPCEVEAELVEWDGELDVDLHGKLPFTRHRINDVHPQMRQLGAPGIVSDFIGTLPGVRDPFDVPDETRWENSGLRPANGTLWGFMVTPRQGARLRELLRQGPVRLKAQISSRVYDGAFHSATGVIRGAELPDEEILFCSHLYEPGANDNASGVGVGLELARTLQQAIVTGTAPPPRRSIRFLFNWEGQGLFAWFEKHRDRVPNMLGGLNIDEIGVAQDKGNSVTHLFMPPAANPSVIGDLALHLAQHLLAPQVRCKPVADRAEIINDTITSDPHIDTVMPCFIQYPARYYHTSGDTPDTLSPPTMERFGLLVGTHLQVLADAGPAETRWLGRLAIQALQRQLAGVELRLLEGTWPFARERTRGWYSEQAELKVGSLRRFGLSDDEASALAGEARGLIEHLGQSPGFPTESVRPASTDELAQAQALILQRRTLGAPKAWDSMALSAEEERTYREILFGNNLDLLFHRICYWADGRRNLLEIVERLEVELDELLQDSAIARTSSGSLIDASAVTLNLTAVLHITKLLVNNGYLDQVQP